jgi:hypothetical protein
MVLNSYREKGLIKIRKFFKLMAHEILHKEALIFLLIQI